MAKGKKRPCHLFQIGRCQKGDNCTYAHVIDPDFKQKMSKLPCRHFAQGKCTRGTACMYSHDQVSDQSTSEDDNAMLPKKPDIDTEQLMMQFKFKIPRDDARERKNARPLGNELATFLQQALKLVSAGTGPMQEVITRLATEGGILRLKELLHREDFETMNDDALQHLFETQLLPLLQLLAHPSVLASVIIEVQHATLLNCVYGAGGQKAVAIFGAVVRCLADCGDSETEPFEAALTVLAYVLEVNGTAQVNNNLRTVAEALVALSTDKITTGPAVRQIQKIRTRIGLGEAIPTINGEKKKSALLSNRPTFTVAQDLPGELSTDGPRHDNDNASIADIQILPTMQEILSSRQEYLPREDPAEWHLPGVPGLVDRHFRLVREDTVGQLRDAAKFELDRLQKPNVQRDSKQQGARTYVYTNVHVVDVGFEDMRGLQFVLSFDQPHQLNNKSAKKRLEWWDESMRLAPDALVCLLGSDGSTIFLTAAGPPPPIMPSKDGTIKVPKRQLHEHYSRSQNPTKAYVVVQLTTNSSDDVEAVMQYARQDSIQLSLVEFPGVVLPAFEPTLAALQRMSGTHDLPFANILAPTHLPPSGEHDARLPGYARRPGFRFNLASITTDKDDMHFDPQAPPSAETVSQRTTLDHAQAEALIAALCRELALTQGPPGAGKSYSSIALLKILVDNKSAARLGPVLLVTFTNHALDQSLENLYDAGVKQIVRIGSRSKSERLAAVNLRYIAMQYDLTKAEKHERWKAKDSMESSGKKIEEVLTDLRQAGSNASVKNYLKGNQTAWYSQLFDDDVDDEGFTKAKNKRKQNNVKEWAKGGSHQHVSRARALEDLRPTDATSLSHAERRMLYNHWVELITQPLQSHLLMLLRAYQDHKSSFDQVRGELDLRVLADANVIGVTTSGLARNLKHLRKLTSKVLLVEEAGEVLEAHTLTALLPSIEHAIFIGDHQQLRPKVQNYELSCENPRGQIALDISLFERLVHPRKGAAGLPYTTLEVQRRMHPSISNLIRSTLYPKIQDAPSVGLYPEVSGLRKRLFWFDHDKNEDGKDEHQHSTSHTNIFEVQMVSALVSHLVKQGVYKASNIAVLTPYLGQLRKLRAALGSFAEIVLNDRDVDDLAKDIADATGPPADNSALVPRNNVAKGNLLQALRLATVDNFQGEEAKVVVISLVRSNDKRKCGFLRTSNRINVLLSRAQHGMYIIGNSETSAHVPMWHEVIELLKAGGNIGKQLELCCPRHPETPQTVSHPDDFVRIAPEAGCALLCNRQLFCGHACINKCHSEALHEAVFCTKPCQRSKPGCTLHACQKPCGAACDIKCQELVKDIDIELKCGHRITALPCWQYKDPASVMCEVMVEKVVPGCEHSLTVPCFQDVSSPFFECSSPCGASLECGHICKKQCKSCNTKEESTRMIRKVDHGECRRTCARDYTNCRHMCQAVCHGTDPCPLCSAGCEVQCSHSRCSKQCCEPCSPCCEEQCASGCPHSACSMPCAAPCNWVPCSRRCTNVLSCGCQCPSLCGAACPDASFCQRCASDDIKKLRADLYEMKLYEEVDLDESPCIFPRCGHVFTVDCLDGWMELSKHYEMDSADRPMKLSGSSEPFSYEELKMCPDCRGSLRDIARYGRIVRRALLDESTKKFIAWSNRAYVPLAKRLQSEQGALITTADTARLPRGKLLLERSRQSQIYTVREIKSNGRYQRLLVLRKDINDFRQKVAREEQPFQRVRDMVESVRRRAVFEEEIPAFEFDQTILQTRGHLLAMALMLRCDLIAITDVVKVWHGMPASLNKPSLEVNFAANRIDCGLLTDTAEKSMNRLQQVESHVFWATFAALECNVMYGEAGDRPNDVRTMEEMKRVAHSRLDMAKELCKKFPGQTQSVAEEVDDARRMLNESTYSSEMRMVVAAMATEFSGTGHWYRCVNGHPFTIGECGAPMETAQCPQCGERIGGSGHQAVAGVEHAADIERDFANLRT